MALTTGKTNSSNVKHNQNGRKNIIFIGQKKKHNCLLENFYFYHFFVHTLQKVFLNCFALLFWAEQNCSDLCRRCHHRSMVTKCIWNKNHFGKAFICKVWTWSEFFVSKKFVIISPRRLIIIRFNFFIWNVIWPVK